METRKKKSPILLKDMARQHLSGNYKTMVLAYFITVLIMGIPLQLLQSLLNLNSAGGSAIYMIAYIILSLLAAVFVLGQNHLYLNITRGRIFQLSDMWYGFRNHADTAILASLIIALKTLAAGIPFIISLCVVLATRNYYIAPLAGVTCSVFLIFTVYFQLTYSQVLFLMLDFPEESATELLAHSARLMKGNRLRLFYLQVSFWGLILLGGMSLYIGLFWVMPYRNMTMTEFYEDICSYRRHSDRRFS
ncbi:MAG: DUF975 family protein [Lachnospiraceae bacterium]|nr:DUF975 family protein [Lachnospiraceae bacterium]